MKSIWYKYKKVVLNLKWNLLLICIIICSSIIYGILLYMILVVFLIVNYGYV